MTLRQIFAVVVGFLCSQSAVASELPSGFVYLSDASPGIYQDIRYSGSHNFVGRQIAGYEANECILARAAALALAAVQSDLNKRDLSLIVWDCYRPMRAVEDFWKWSQGSGDDAMKREFFPHIQKEKLFSSGYLSRRSAHSRGYAVDVGIVPIAFKPRAKGDGVALTPCTSAKGARFEDGALDFGTGYDCLDPMSDFRNGKIGKEARRNRNLLREVMVQHGFKPYAKEWWHFELQQEPSPRRYFNFAITKKAVVGLK